MLFGDELPQSIRNISQVKRMAAKSVSNKRRHDSNSSSHPPDSKKHRYNDRFDRLNSKRYDYRKPPFSERTVASKKVGDVNQTVMNQAYPKVGGRLCQFYDVWTRLTSDTWIYRP